MFLLGGGTTAKNTTARGGGGHTLKQECLLLLLIWLLSFYPVSSFMQTQSHHTSLLGLTGSSVFNCAVCDVSVWLRRIQEGENKRK